MKAHYLSCISLFLLCLVQSLNGQDWNIQPPGFDPNAYTEVSEDHMPEPLSCAKMETGYFKVKFAWEEAGDFVSDLETFETDKSEWTDEDMEAYDNKYSEANRDALNTMTEELNTDVTDLRELILESFQDYFAGTWGDGMCAGACTSNTDICESKFWRDYIDVAAVSARYSTTLFSLDDGEVTHAMEVMISYEGWAYFRYACTCKYDERLISSTPDPVWDNIDLTDVRMKPGYPFIVPVDKPFPWLPVGAGVAGGGTIVYLLTKDDNAVNCGFSATIQTTNSTCGQANGTATLDVVPSGTYTYLWENGATTASLQNIPAGTYTATVTQTGTTCSNVVVATVVNTDSSFEATINTNDAHCGQQDGSVTVSLSPAAFYTLTWSNGGTGEVQTNLAPGAYTVTVTLGSSCTETYQIDIGELPPEFTIDLTTTPAGCGSSDGTATATIDEPGTYEYTWSDGSMDATLAGVAAGEYSVTVTLAGTSCTQTGTVVIDELPPDFTLSFTTTPAGCGVSDGTATVSVEPAGTYTYLWNDGSTIAELSNVPAGEYTITVTIEGTTCAQTATVTIEEMPADFDLTLTSAPATCGIGDGSASVTVDPPGTYIYTWTNGSTTSEAQDLAAGEYTVTVSNAGGCAVTDDVTVSETPAEYITSTSSIPGNCIGEGTDIILDLQTPGSGPMEITATGPDGAHVVSAPAGTVNLSAFFTVLPGAWHIVVRDLSLSAACTDEADIQVDDNTVFTPLDDTYETTVDQPASGNVLDNDTGLNLMVGDHTEPSGGTLVLNPDGSFTFTPPAGESGEFSFQYEVTDACGTSAIVTVTITVNSLDCLFDVTFSTTSADCGLTNGAIITVVTPPGNYTYTWSNGATTADLTDIPAGQYSVTVTSVDLNCTHEYVVDVEELPVSHITDVSTSPGNCTGEGEITITLTTPGDGPLVLIITGPEGTTQFNLTEGQHNLSSSMNIPSGDYTITVYDQGAGELCSETIDVTVPDNTTELVAVDDFYETAFNTSFLGNVLDNDEGLGLTLTEVTQVVGGIVEFNDDGGFTFTPDPGFSGTASFTYTVTDACGNTGFAFVEITVAEAICDFTVQFINTNTSCGFEDGTASVVVDPPGSYFYEWSNGESGEMISNVGAGMYSVTIEDVNLGCSLTFDTEVGEDPAMYISNVEVTQPACPLSGDIQFDVSSPGGGPFDITITHPNGVDVITVPAGTVILSDFIEITAGDYIISVIDVNAGPSCEESFSATIDPSTMIEIVVEAVIPPSEPTSMDGAIIVVITMPGTPPYSILLNGLFWGVTTEPVFTIEGLGAGDYTVQIEDANGCLSNILDVNVPLPGTLQLQLGFGLITVPVPVEGTLLPELPETENRTRVHSFALMTLSYRVGGIDQESGVAMLMDKSGSVFRLSQLVELWERRFHGCSLKAQGGMSVDVMQDQIPSQHWMLRGSATKRIGKQMIVDGSVSLRGWTTIEWPVVAVGVRLPLRGR